MLRSFHAITDGEQARTKPLRILVLAARAGITFAALARRAPLDYLPRIT